MSELLDCASLDLLSTNAMELRILLQTKQINSVQLVRAYLRQIAQHDTTLKSLISIAPEKGLISSAALLDKERLDGRVRSQLHGIPVVLKVRNWSQVKSSYSCEYPITDNHQGLFRNVCRPWNAHHCWIMGACRS